MYTRRQFSEEEESLSHTLREKLELVEKLILDSLPDSRERSIALSHLEDTMLHANLAISNNGVTDIYKK